MILLARFDVSSTQLKRGFNLLFKFIYGQLVTKSRIIKLWNEIPCHIRHLSKNKLKQTLRKLLFNILNSDDDFIHTPTLILKKGKIGQKCRKFKFFKFICLINFFYSLISSPHPYYDFNFSYFRPGTNVEL